MVSLFIYFNRRIKVVFCLEHRDFILGQVKTILQYQNFCLLLLLLGGMLRIGSASNSLGNAISSRNAFGFNAYDYVGEKCNQNVHTQPIYCFLLGYSMEIGRFIISMDYWGVTAAPRAEGLLGKVINNIFL